MKRVHRFGVIVVFTLTGCVAPRMLEHPELPSLAYTKNLRDKGTIPSQPAQRVVAQQQVGFQSPERVVPIQSRTAQQGGAVVEPKARLQFVKDYPTSPTEAFSMEGMVQNLDPNQGMGYEVYPSAEQLPRHYQGPLNLGQPGMTASLWREASHAGSLFRDHRAYQPMDLITVVVDESSEGTKEADTEVKKDSSILAGIANFFNFETDAQAKNTGLDTSTLVNANWESEVKSEGDTTRKGTLRARIAAVVIETLPSGVMRIEGKKIIAVNEEEQIMVLSGLVRPRDVTSNNEVNSSKIANLRIDYFGRGAVGDAQYVGWFGRFLQAIWPF